MAAKTVGSDSFVAAVSSVVNDIVTAMGMGVNRFAAHCGVPQSTLDGILHGRSPSMYTVAKIESGANKPVGYVASEAWKRTGGEPAKKKGAKKS